MNEYFITVENGICKLGRIGINLLASCGYLSVVPILVVLFPFWLLGKLEWK